MLNFKIIVPLCVSHEDVHARLHEWVHHHNQVQSNLGDRIRSGVYALLHELSQQQADMIKKSRWRWGNNESYPGVYTNRYELKQLTRSGIRTFDGQFKKLLATGIIRIRSERRQLNFTIWVHPWFILGNPYPKPPVVNLFVEEATSFDLSLKPSKRLPATNPTELALQANGETPKIVKSTAKRLLSVTRQANNPE